MRLTQIACPKCAASLTSKAGIEEGTAVACPKCKQTFKAVPAEQVEDDFDVVDDEDEEVLAKKSSRPQRDDDEDDERPRTKKRRPADDDDRPARSQRPINDDDERPKRMRNRPRKTEDEDEELGAFAQLKQNIWVRIGVLAVLLGVLGALSYMLFLKEKKSDTTPIVRENSDDDDIRKPIKPILGEKENKLAATDRDRLQGSWAATSAIANGEPYSALALKSMRFTVNGDRWDYQNKHDPQSMSHGKVDDKKSPAELDLADTARKTTTLAIYRFVDKDTLEICYSRSNAERPKKLDAPKGSNCVYMKLKREAKSTNPKGKDPESKDQDMAGTSQLQGTWLLTSVHHPELIGEQEAVKGALMAMLALSRQNQTSTIKLTITDDEWTLDDPNEAEHYTVNTTSDPQEIDFVHPDGSKTLGIYRMQDKDRIELCFSLDGDRPVTFTPDAQGISFIFVRGQR